MEEGKALPTEHLGEARQLHHESELDIHEVDDVVTGTVDDEYATVGVREPKVCVTTSRDPSSRLKQFAKEIKLCFPNAQAINRGNHRVDELMDACRKADFTDVVLLNETRGMPDAMVISHLPFGPTAYFTLSNCVLRHDIPECKPASQTYPHLVLDGLNSKIGRRLARIIQALYPVPKEDSKRVITFANRDDFISFRHHMYTKPQGNVTLEEAGPRFEMQPYEVNECTTCFSSCSLILDLDISFRSYIPLGLDRLPLITFLSSIYTIQIRLGTLENDLAEKEWVMRPYMNTSRKRQALSS